MNSSEVPTKPRPAAMNSARSIFQAAFPGMRDADYDRSLGDLSIDSFALLEFRFTAERLIGQTIPDRDWLDLKNPSGIISYLESRITAMGSHSEGVTAASTSRSILLNMPQMALSGLSESWLWKQVGDIHWEMICTGLETPSHALMDGDGDRLYATITRLNVEASAPLAAFAENDRLDLTGRVSRLGAGIFFSEVNGVSAGKTIRASIMSSFTKRGSVTGNSNLLKGQPTIPPNCQIPELSDMPEFGLGYRDRRGKSLPAADFECDYDIIPCHDINGVGLLYFAAYPSITEICEIKYMGRGNQWACDASLVGRDIYYFANCDIDDRICYRSHSRVQRGSIMELHSSLSRKRDNTLMAYVITRKELKLA